jgi:hypothetical protein
MKALTIQNEIRELKLVRDNIVNEWASLTMEVEVHFCRGGICGRARQVPGGERRPEGGGVQP